MKKVIAALATAALATTVALPAKAGYGWNVTHNTRFQFVPRSWRETTVVSNTINTGVHFQWTRYDGETFNYPVHITLEGNTCERPPTPPGSSHLTVCVDRSYYVIKPNWDMRNHYSNVELQCNRPIKIDNKFLNLQGACDHLSTTR